MQLSFLSRTTSISNSFQPRTDSSSKTSVTGDCSRPFETINSNSSRLYAIPLPLPPNVKLGLTIVGKPTVSWIFQASASVFAIPATGTSSPISCIASRNCSRSSAILIASRDAAMSSTSNFSRTPSEARSSAQFSPVCPPIVGSKAEGRSFSIIRSNVCHLMGSI